MRLKKIILVTVVLSLFLTSLVAASSDNQEESNGHDDLFNLNLNLDFSGGQEFKLDEQMAQRVRAIIKHFKQDDPVGIPSEMGNFIQDPMKVPNLEQTFSGTKMKFDNLSLYGMNKFRLQHVQVNLSELKIGVGLSIEELFVKGLYQMSSWFMKAKGKFDVTITNVSAEADVGFVVDDDGILQVHDVKMDVKFGDIKMNFENLGIMGSIFQGMVNSVGGFLFDSIKPMILQEVEGKVRGELNRQARSVPQQFPNSINPVDMFLASARMYMRQKGLDPFPIPDYNVSSSWSTFELTDGVLHGLASVHRAGSLIISFEENIVKVSVHVGAENLKGKIKWRWAAMRGLLYKEGTLEFSIEYITAEIKVGQPANLDNPTKIEEIDLEIGNIAVLSDGIGTLDYIVEAFLNILPNILRKQIIDSLEEPLREFVEIEVRKELEIEKMIEERLP